MFIQDNLQKLKVFSEEDFSNTKFLVMFIGVVIAPLALFAIGGQLPNTIWQSGLAWTLFAIGLLPLVSIATRLTMYRSSYYERRPPSIAASIA